jgi:hypothetical protein
MDHVVNPRIMGLNLGIFEKTHCERNEVLREGLEPFSHRNAHIKDFPPSTTYYPVRILLCG